MQFCHNNKKQPKLYLFLTSMRYKMVTIILKLAFVLNVSYNLICKIIEEYKMRRLATTKLSSKGQIVIPEEIRDKLGLHSGDKFIVIAEKDVIIFKIIRRKK